MKRDPLKETCALVIGLGISGRAAVRLLLRRGAHVIGVDGNDQVLNQNEEIAALRTSGATILHQSAQKDVEGFTLVVVSPGVPPSHPLCLAALAKGIPIIGEVELALREITIPCIGITGTNGKTTVTLLTTHVLNACGKKALALGNVGTPIADAVQQIEEHGCDYAVVELSSFQLDTLHVRCLDIGVLLNITPDHLDRYGTLDAYAFSKAHMASLIRPGGQLYLFEGCYKDFSGLFSKEKPLLYGYTPACAIYASNNIVYDGGVKAFALPPNYSKNRSHDVENIMASYALCRRYGITGEQFLAALATFKKPHHRIEFVRQVDGVSYYDDSKGTNIDAVVRAVEALEGNIILIAGGVDKGAPYDPWIPVFRGRVGAICAIGQAAEKIHRDLSGHYPVSLHGTLEEAVLHAKTQAKSGDIILLSPGCSSYDMFKDYVHRGQEFQRVVQLI